LLLRAQAAAPVPPDILSLKGDVRWISLSFLLNNCRSCCKTLTTVAAKPEALTPLEHQFLQDGFVFLLFVILHFHRGIQITPVADAQIGLFDIPLVTRYRAVQHTK
jgi:hypothetical protein